MSAPLLSVESVSYTYARDGRSVLAVDNVSLEVGASETVGICGPSGSGKSTLAKLIARLVPPSAGSIRFMGRDWSSLSGASLRASRPDLQMVFQNPNAAMNPRATVEETIGDPLRIHGRASGVDRTRRVDALLEQVGLDRSYRGRRRHELSGGQRQRVAIARALACQPRLIILDEATAALDTTIRASILELLADIRRRSGVAYLMISHDIALVRAFADRVAIMDAGRIVESGAASDIIDHPRSDIARALVAATPRLWNDPL